MGIELRKTRYRAPTLWEKRKAKICQAIARGWQERCAVEDPGHVYKPLARKPGEPVSAWEGTGREGKSKDASRR